jgi:hypothetical protein
MVIESREFVELRRLIDEVREEIERSSRENEPPM